MKLPVNGGINLSISDGWWCEGYNRENGWTIGPVLTTELPDDKQNDYDDAEALYKLLEGAVAPLYYDLNPAGLPANWIAMSKRSLKSLTAMYSSNRMLTDYAREAYLPAARRRDQLAENDWALCKNVAAWQAEVPARFGTLKLEEIIISGAKGNTMTCGEPIHVRLHLHLGEMKVEEIQVQLVIGRCHHNGNFRSKPEVLRLEPRPADHGDGGMNYSASYTPSHNGQYRYGIRVIPVCKGQSTILDSGLVLWA